MTTAASPAADSYATTRARFEQHGQGHVFRFWDELNAQERAQLLTDAQHVQVEHVHELFDRVMEYERQQQALSSASATTATAAPASASASPSSSSSPTLTPFTSITDVSTTSLSQRAEWHRAGLRAIAHGHVSTVLMAGGQGTRLGSSAPKGCYDVGLPSHKSLFQLQAERIQRLRVLAAAQERVDGSTVHLPWYIMTSIATHAATVAFFTEHSFFGVPEADIVFFQQSELPALTFDAKIILESKHKIALAPNGNGGIFEGLARSGALADMARRGVQHVHVYGVDNVLVKVGDPTLVGFALAKGASCVNKVVLKTDPHEKVGVMCYKDGKASVVEYSELPTALAEARDPTTNTLLYSAANIAQHYFSLAFLQQVAAQQLNYHIARKTIPTIDAESGEAVRPAAPNGIKLEMFIFDIFERTTDMQALAVAREAEFSAVKNATGADSPATARANVSAYHRSLVQRAFSGESVVFFGDDGNGAGAVTGLFEISPLVSYDGEGLDKHPALVSTKTITLPYHLC